MLRQRRAHRASTRQASRTAPGRQEQPPVPAAGTCALPPSGNPPTPLVSAIRKGRSTSKAVTVCLPKRPATQSSANRALQQHTAHPLHPDSRATSQALLTMTDGFSEQSGALSNSRTFPAVQVHEPAKLEAQAKRRPGNAQRTTGQSRSIVDVSQPSDHCDGGDAAVSSPSGRRDVQLLVSWPSGATRFSRRMTAVRTCSGSAGFSRSMRTAELSGSLTIPSRMCSGLTDSFPSSNASLPARVSAPHRSWRERCRTRGRMLSESLGRTDTRDNLSANLLKGDV